MIVNFQIASRVSVESFANSGKESAGTTKSGTKQEHLLVCVHQIFRYRATRDVTRETVTTQVELLVDSMQPIKFSLFWCY